MKVAVTGATGFVGRSLVARLAKEGHAVVALVRAKGDAARRATVEAAGAVCREGDLADEASLVALMEGAEVVFHLAGLTGYAHTKEKAEAVNLVGTENVLAAAKAAKVKRVVFLSCEAVTRGAEARSYVDEDFIQVERVADAATMMKALAEDLVVAASDDVMGTVTLRAGWVWGPDDTSTLPGVVAAMKSGAYRWVDEGRALVATTYIDNLVEGLMKAATVREVTGRAYYVTDDERVSMKSFVQRLAGAVGVTPGRKNAPFALAMLSAWFDDVVLKKGEGARTAVRFAGQSAHFNIQRARKELGYAPVVTVDEGMARLAAWGKGAAG